MNKLLLSLVFDNSSSMKGERIGKLKNELEKFNRLSDSISDSFECSFITTTGITVKDFKSKTIGNITEGGLALLDRAINLGLNELDKRRRELELEGVNLYKQWFVLLSDGQCYENLSMSVVKLREGYRGGKFTYFPFFLGNSVFDERFDELKKLKIPLTIDNDQYDKLFNWIFEAIKTRVSTPIEESIKVDSRSFAGWIVS